MYRRERTPTKYERRYFEHIVLRCRKAKWILNVLNILAKCHLPAEDKKDIFAVWWYIRNGRN